MEIFFIYSANAQITYVHHIKSKLVIFWMVIPLKYGIIIYIPQKNRKIMGSDAEHSLAGSNVGVQK